MTKDMPAQTIRSAFARYRTAMDIARDPNEGRGTRTKAWVRAANARAQIDRELARLERGR